MGCRSVCLADKFAAIVYLDSFGNSIAWLFHLASLKNVKKGLDIAFTGISSASPLFDNLVESKTEEVYEA